MGAIFSVITGSKLFTWVKDYIFIILLVVAGTGLIWYGGHVYTEQVSQLAQVQALSAAQGQKIVDLNDEFGRLRESTNQTLASMTEMKVNIEKLEKSAAARDVSVNKRLDQIKNDPNMTPEQKRQESSVTYIQSLRSTYCAYQPDSCKEQP